MINLSFDQRSSIGLQYVLELMSPCSPYGAERMRKLKAYTRKEYLALEAELNNVQKLVLAFEAHKQLIGKISRIFMQVKDVKRILKKCRENALTEVELFELKCFVLHTEGLCKDFDELNEEVLLDGISFLSCDGALTVLDPDNTRVSSFYVSDTHSEKLRDIRREKRKIEDAVRKFAGKRLSDELSIKRLHIIAAEEEEEGNVRADISKRLNPYLDSLLQNADNIGHMDVLLQKAELAVRFSAVRPTITQNAICFVDVYNPKISSALRSQGKEFVPVSIQLKNGSTVLTGANMGGKSVALKTITLNTLLIHLGFFCFAKSACSPIFDSINLVSEDMQSIDKGLSSFGAEIVQLKEVLSHTQQGFAFNVLDEFARGTNPEEGAKIVGAVTRYLNEKKAISLLTTHYDGIAAFAGYHYQVAGLKNINLDRLRAEIEMAGENSFDLISKHMDYRLLEAGEEAECPRDALNICRLLSLDNEILDIIEKSY